MAGETFLSWKRKTNVRCNEPTLSAYTDFLVFAISITPF